MLECSFNLPLSHFLANQLENGSSLANNNNVWFMDWGTQTQSTIISYNVDHNFPSVDNSIAVCLLTGSQRLFCDN